VATRLIWTTNLAYSFSLKSFQSFHPCTPLQGFEKNLFVVYSLKLTRTIKSHTLITNIAISEFKTGVPKKLPFFLCVNFGPYIGFLTLPSHRTAFRTFRKAFSDARFQASSDSGWIEIIWNVQLLMMAKYNQSPDKMSKGVLVSLPVSAPNTFELKWDHKNSMQFFMLYPNK
jgi:hypothetical protein